MTTSKQRIQAYVDLQLFEAFEAERIEWNISQSQALERILAERYSAKKQGLSVDHLALSERVTRLEAEIRQLVEINHKRFGMTSNRIDGLEGAISQLFSEIPEKASNSDVS